MSSTHQELRLKNDEVQELLLGRWAEDRRQLRKMMEDPVFHYQFNLTKEEQRELTFNSCKNWLIANLSARLTPRNLVDEITQEPMLPGLLRCFMPIHLCRLKAESSGAYLVLLF